VLRDDNSRCDPFETGKLVVTSLRNYATPLIRYDVGDYGELGEPCDCGRGLPVLKKVNGRVRNMLQLPDGNTHWPNFGFQHIMQVVPLRQFQVVQHNLEQVELKLVVSDSVDSEQEDRIKQILIEHLGHPFEIAISYHSELARSASGKFEDFVSMHGVN
jgi:phenylacetate-CoA ligase